MYLRLTSEKMIFLKSSRQTLKISHISALKFLLTTGPFLQANGVFLWSPVAVTSGSESGNEEGT